MAKRGDGSWTYELVGVVGGAVLVWFGLTYSGKWAYWGGFGASTLGWSAYTLGRLRGMPEDAVPRKPKALYVMEVGEELLVLTYGAIPIGAACGGLGLLFDWPSTMTWWGVAAAGVLVFPLAVWLTRAPLRAIERLRAEIEKAPKGE